MKILRRQKEEFTIEFEQNEQDRAEMFLCSQWCKSGEIYHKKTVCVCLRVCARSVCVHVCTCAYVCEHTRSLLSSSLTLIE